MATFVPGGPWVGLKPVMAGLGTGVTVRTASSLVTTPTGDVTSTL